MRYRMTTKTGHPTPGQCHLGLSPRSLVSELPPMLLAYTSPIDASLVLASNFNVIKSIDSQNQYRSRFEKQTVWGRTRRGCNLHIIIIHEIYFRLSNWVTESARSWRWHDNISFFDYNDLSAPFRRHNRNYPDCRRPQHHGLGKESAAILVGDVNSDPCEY